MAVAVAGSWPAAEAWTVVSAGNGIIMVHISKPKIEVGGDVAYQPNQVTILIPACSLV